MKLKKCEKKLTLNCPQGELLQLLKIQFGVVGTQAFDAGQLILDHRHGLRHENSKIRTIFVLGGGHGGHEDQREQHVWRLHDDMRWSRRRNEVQATTAPLQLHSRELPSGAP